MVMGLLGACTQLDVSWWWWWSRGSERCCVWEVVCAADSYVRSLVRSLGHVLLCGFIVTVMTKKNTYSFTSLCCLPFSFLLPLLREWQRETVARWLHLLSSRQTLCPFGNVKRKELFIYILLLSSLPPISWSKYINKEMTDALSLPVNVFVFLVHGGRRVLEGYRGFLWLGGGVEGRVMRWKINN